MGTLGEVVVAGTPKLGASDDVPGILYLAHDRLHDTLHDTWSLWTHALHAFFLMRSCLWGFCCAQGVTCGPHVHQGPGASSWSVRLASVEIWERDSEREPVQGPHTPLQRVCSRAPHFLLLQLGAGGPRTGPLPLSDSLCGPCRSHMPLLTPQHHCWKSDFNFCLVGEEQRGERPP